MPTYQYACTECGHEFEQFQSFSDDALTECPNCGGKLRKVYGSVGVVFKGSGFYRTDSRSGSSSDIPATPAKKESGSSDTPAAAKTEKKAAPAKTESSSSSSASTSKPAAAS